MPRARFPSLSRRRPPGGPRAPGPAASKTMPSESLPRDPEARPTRGRGAPRDSPGRNSFAAPEVLVIAARLFGISRRDGIAVERHDRLLRIAAGQVFGHT